MARIIGGPLDGAEVDMPPEAKGGWYTIAYQSDMVKVSRWEIKMLTVLVGRGGCTARYMYDGSKFYRPCPP